MPKKPNKGKSKGASRLDQGSDEDTAFNDNASIISNVSSGSLMRDEGLNGAQADTSGGQVDEFSQEEVFEEKLREAMDLAGQKSAQGRTVALGSMCTAFLKKFIPDFVEDRRMTFTDIIERALKKGKNAEQTAAARLAVLLCIQLGGGDVMKDLKSVFITLMSDPAAPMKTRAAVASALGDCAFLVSQPEDYNDIMNSLEKVFTVKAGANASEDFFALQTASISAWTLLSTLLPSSRALECLESHLDLFEILLEAGNVDLRIATGEALAVLYESGYDHDEDAVTDLVDILIPRLQELSKDSHKYRSKKDRKEQKSSFRDILKTIEEGDEYYEKVGFSKRETLEITSWSMKKQYDHICKVLASGMNLHLSENELIRSIFGLGAPMPSLSEMQSSRPSKHERQHANQMAFKWRTQTRGKNRDKRSAVV